MDLSRRDSIIMRVTLSSLTIIVIGCVVAVCLFAVKNSESALWFPFLVLAITITAFIVRIIFLVWKPRTVQSTARQGDVRNVMSNMSVASQTTVETTATSSGHPVLQRSDYTVHYISFLRDSRTTSDDVFPSHRNQRQNSLSEPQENVRIEFFLNPATLDPPPNYSSAMDVPDSTIKKVEEPPPNYDEALHQHE